MYAFSNTDANTQSTDFGTCLQLTCLKYLAACVDGYGKQGLVKVPLTSTVAFYAPLHLASHLPVTGLFRLGTPLCTALTV
jgi:hypothetical protein